MKLTAKDIEKIVDFINFLKILNNDYDKFTDIFHLMELHGFHITKSEFYSPIPEISKLDNDVFLGKDLPGIDWNESNQIKLLNELSQYSNEFQNLIDGKKFDMNNGAFGTFDAPLYFSIIRHFAPNKIIEVGAGYSTILSSATSKLNNKTKVIAIDPYVDNELKKKIPASVEFIDNPVQKIPVSMFRDLNENDILFIDSSHVSKIGSDVNYLYLEILPKLRDGVLVHIHDIFLPNQYPMSWIKNDHRRFWNEQYLLDAFLIGNSLFEIILANSFMSIRHPELLRKLYKTQMPVGGGSFWIRKTGN